MTALQTGRLDYRAVVCMGDYNHTLNQNEEARQT